MCVLMPVDGQNITQAFSTKLNSMALVRERTIPTERPPPVGEVSAKHSVHIIKLNIITLLCLAKIYNLLSVNFTSMG
jgi:hypothetical protein